jgi:predicted cupin superfamily sugar epimerase
MRQSLFHETNFPKRIDYLQNSSIMEKLTAEDVKRILNLHPHPREGGWYNRTYESPERLAMPCGERRAATSIYYLLEHDTFSEMHVLGSDELFHHYTGAPVELLQLHEDGSASRHVLGSDLTAGERPQLLVPRGVWQGSRLLPGSDRTAFALLGCTVSPGFEYEDYQSAPRDMLVAQWPTEAKLITALTNF